MDILKFIEEHYSTNTTLLVLVLLAVGFGMKKLVAGIKKLVEATWELRGEFDEIKTKLNKIDEHDKKIDAMDDKLAELTKTTTVIKHAMQMLVGMMGTKYKPVLDMFSEKHSPRKLNDAGKQILKEIEGEAFLQKHKETLFDSISSLQPLSALDVENAAYSACISLSMTPDFNYLKDYVYNRETMPLTNKEGKEIQYEVTINDVCFVLSLPLRDMYLEEHPELMPKEN